MIGDVALRGGSLWPASMFSFMLGLALILSFAVHICSYSLTSRTVVKLEDDGNQVWYDGWLWVLMWPLVRSMRAKNQQISWQTVFLDQEHHLSGTLKLNRWTWWLVKNVLGELSAPLPNLLIVADRNVINLIIATVSLKLSSLWIYRVEGSNVWEWSVDNLSFQHLL